MDSREVWLVDITTDLDVPVTLAYATASGGG
ncbi:YcaO-like family protein [Mycobacterium marinum]|nr:YcaO-like family protein [Mycobacterium marinum]